MVSEAPVWLDPISIAARLGMPLLLLVALVAERHRRGKRGVYGLVVLWTLAGFISGFKFQVFLPVALLAVASWMNGNLRLRYVSATLFLIFAAYSVIEPLRLYRDSYGQVDVAEAFSTLFDDSAVEVYGSTRLLDRVVNRIDNTRTGATALKMYNLGQLDELKRRVDEAYSLLLPLAFVPRYFWPDKPLADLGRVLSIQLTGNEYNSVSLIRPVADYIWGGINFVIVSGIVSGFLISLGSVIANVWIRNPLQRILLLFVAISLSIGSDYALYTYIGLLRVFLFMTVAIYVLKKTGWVVLRRAD